MAEITQHLTNQYLRSKGFTKKQKFSYINRDAPKHSANDIKAGKWSMSKPAATARANAMPCSFCNTSLRVSRTFKS
jgi:hypothetical protein